VVVSEKNKKSWPFIPLTVVFILEKSSKIEQLVGYSWANGHRLTVWHWTPANASHSKGPEMKTTSGIGPQPIGVRGQTEEETN